MKADDLRRGLPAALVACPRCGVVGHPLIRSSIPKVRLPDGTSVEVEDVLVCGDDLIGVADAPFQLVVGDVYEGTGTHRVRVEVLGFDEKSARCLLVRSGKEKRISRRTLQTAYRLVARGGGCEHGH